MKKGSDSPLSRSSSALNEASGDKRLSSHIHPQKPALRAKTKMLPSGSPSLSYTSAISTIKYSHVNPASRPNSYTPPNARDNFVLPSGKTVSTYRIASPAVTDVGTMTHRYQSSSRNSSLDPYARPMSGNKVPISLTLLEKTIQKTLLSVSPPLSVTVSPVQPHVQKNSFLRPQSGSKSYSNNQVISLPSRGSISLSVNPSDSRVLMTFENDRENVDPTKLLRHKQLHEQLVQNCSELNASPKKSTFPVLAQLIRPHHSFPDPPDSTADNIETLLQQKTADISGGDAAYEMASDAARDKRMAAQRPMSASSSTQTRIYTRPTTPCRDLASKVRNLNYTPSKPYSEVNTPSLRPVTTSADSRVAADVTQNLTSMPQNLLSSNSSLVSQQSGFYRKAYKDIETLPFSARSTDTTKTDPGTHSVYNSDSCISSESDDADDVDWSDVVTPSGERLPGDGEASYEYAGDEDDEDDALDELAEDDNLESDGSGSTCDASTSSRRPTSTLRTLESTTEIQAPLSLLYHTEGSPKEKIIYPALTPSLFSNIPPTLHFIKEGEKVERLSWDVRKLLKWRLSPITPNIVKAALARVGFRITKKPHDWLGCWGKHMKAQAFKSIRDYQKLNHFPGTFQLGRKDRLWRNLCKMQLHHGRREFNFFPQTYVLPFDMKMLKRSWEENSMRQKWIIKPPASARGIGVRVIHKWSQLPRRKPLIVQRYLSRPFLINESKFDMRVYVYVSCYDPLRIYVFDDGLARFASCKYSGAMKSLNNRYMHLTNYSINKKNIDYQSNTDDKVCQGHKWSLKSLWLYLRQLGVNTSVLWENIKDLIIKTIICAEPQISSMVKANLRSRYTVHELFGFDILLDENLKPWILEVNISPSLHSNSPLDINIKGQMIKDLFNIAGFHVPDKADLSNPNSYTNEIKSGYSPSKTYCSDRRLYTTQISSDEKAKHAFYCLKHHDDAVVQTILDHLTPSDVRVITESIDEDSRKGMFQRIYPTPSTHKYLKFFEQPRYHNLLLDEWVHKYNRCEMKVDTAHAVHQQRDLFNHVPRQSPSCPRLPRHHRTEQLERASSPVESHEEVEEKRQRV